jgi:chemotaxis protein MotB
MAKIEKVYEGTPTGNWMVTFSDMNTLLLTFFVLLFSMSSLTTEKFEEIFQPNKGDQLGLLSTSSLVYASRLVFDPMPAIPKDRVRTALNVFRQDGDKFHAPINLPDGVEITISDAPGGVVTIVLADRMLFAPGQTELTRESMEFLDKVRLFIGRIISVIPRRIIVEGHSDNTAPEEERYIISARRAESVLLHLLGDGTLPPELFSVIGYGSSKPLVPNNSDANRAKNRRVRIVLEPPEGTDENILF